MTAVFTLAVLGRGLWPQKTDVRQQASAYPAAMIRQDAVQHITAPPAGSLLPPLDGNTSTAMAPQQSLVIVEPQQTLAEISRRYLGEYNLANVRKLLALNPSLTNPDHIEIGQQIRLPRDRVGADEASVAAAEEQQPPRK